MKTFVTGATGFIGTRVARKLLAANDEILCLVRRPSSAAQELERLGARLISGDVTDRASLDTGMQGCSLVIHIAGLYSFWEKNPAAFRAVNVEGTRNVMEAALASGVSKVVHVSTVGVYGKPADVPFTETSRPGPACFSRYFRTKAEADALVWDLHRTRGLPAVVVYPAAVLGPGDPKATGQYLRDLVERRLPARVFDHSVLTFVHVDDVAEAIVRAGGKKGIIGERYIVGAERLSFRQVNELVAGIAGVPLARFALPGLLAMAAAGALTGVSRVTGRRPPWGMSLDQMAVMREGFSADGAKAERELGLQYTPIRTAITEVLAARRC